MIEIIRDHAGRVKRWSSGEMALRWAAAGMLAAQDQFRRVKGYQELPQLALALERATAQEPGILDLPYTSSGGRRTMDKQPKTIDKRRLGPTQLEITPIGLGTMQFGTAGIDQDTVQPVVRAALQGGINWFDTAELYGRGRSERALTTALHDLGVAPGTVVIATKWTPILRPAASIIQSLDRRLEALQGYPIDLHQIHYPYGALSSRASQLRAMARLAGDGKIAAVGVSNFSARQMQAASQVLGSQGLALASNEVQISLLHRNIEHNGVLAAARRLGVTLIAYSPQRSGILTGKFHDDPSRIRAVSPLQRRLLGLNDAGLARTRPLIEELRAIAHAYGASPGQVALAWLVQFYGDTVVAIPGASKPHQAEQSAAATHLRLTDKELRRLDAASRAPAAR